MDVPVELGLGVERGVGLGEERPREDRGDDEADDMVGGGGEEDFVKVEG